MGFGAAGARAEPAQIVVTAEECAVSAVTPDTPTDSPEGVPAGYVAAEKAKGTRFFKKNPSACYGLVAGNQALLEACARYPIDFNQPCVFPTSGTPRASGRIPLAFAVARLDEPAYELLRAHGAAATLRPVPSWIYSANLVYSAVAACGNRYTDACARIVSSLVHGGADVNDRDSNKDVEKPLSLAVRDGNVELVKLLISLGADVNAGGADGKTALDQALESGQEDAAEILRQHGAGRSFRYRVHRAVEGTVYFIACLFGCGTP